MISLKLVNNYLTKSFGQCRSKILLIKFMRFLKMPFSFVIIDTAFPLMCLYTKFKISSAQSKPGETLGRRATGLKSREKLRANSLELYLYKLCQPSRQRAKSLAAFLI
jgi:hypothetical protein